MSIWNIGLNDVTENEQAYKDKLSSQDGQIAALQTKLMKQEYEMKELQVIYNEKIRQLSNETDRACKLEADLSTCSETLRNEKVASQNVDQALSAARRTIKQKEVDIKELQANLESLSHLSDQHKSYADNLRQEKATLEIRVKELRKNHDLPMPPCHSNLVPLCSCSSSPPGDSVAALEKELDQLRSSLSQLEVEILLANERASHAQDERVRMENEKTAVERRMTRELDEARTALQEKEAEARDEPGVLGGESRENALLERIEEDEVKISALEKILQVDEAKWMKEAEILRNEYKHKLLEADNRLADMVRVKEEALEELEKARTELSTWIESQHNRTIVSMEHSTASEQLVHLLTMVDRLRSERDTLRMSLEFVQSESRFEIEALNAQLPSLPKVVGTLSPHITRQTIPGGVVLHSTEIEMSPNETTNILGRDIKLRGLDLALVASGIVIQHLQSDIAILGRCVTVAHDSHNEAHQQLGIAQQNMDVLQDQLKFVEEKLDVTILSLEAATSQRDETLYQLEDKDTALERMTARARAADEAQDYFKLQLDVIESERDSLLLQLTNLENDLTSTQDSLKAMDGRYNDLKAHQLDAMSKTEATRVLQKELTEERSRVGRRDELVVMLQHDIQRLETNLRLQEERLSEMTIELEMMAAAKDAMVDDCADAREARDRTQVKLEDMEVEVEMQLEENDRTVEALVQVIVQTVGGSREVVKMEQRRAKLAQHALLRLEEERKMVLGTLDKMREPFHSREDVNEQVRQSTLALAVSQIGLGKALAHIQNTREAKAILEHEYRGLQCELGKESTEKGALIQELEILRHTASATSLDFSNRTTALEQQVQHLQKALSEIESIRNATVKQLPLSEEHLSTTTDSTQQSLSERDPTDQEIYTMELDETRTRLAESWRILEEQTSHAAMKVELEKSTIDASNASHEFGQRLTESSTDLQETIARLQSAEQKQELLATEVSRLQKDLDTALAQKSALEAAQGELEVSLDHISKQLKASQEVARQSEEHRETEQQLADQLTELRNKLHKQSQELEKVGQESERLACQLKEEFSRRQAEGDSHQKELELVDTQHKNAESALDRLQKELNTMQSKIKQSDQEIEVLRQDKLSLQEQVTMLEAEVQRFISLHRFLESQVKASEARVSVYTDELEQSRADLAHSEKAAKAAEVNLSLQGAQHRREMCDLNRQLTTLQSQPNLQNALGELEERNNEMEELLRNKCAEIEENDDRALEMLKENKKLSSKIESLTRRVQNLQTKLAAAKASLPTLNTAPVAPIVPMPPSVGSTSAASPSSDSSNPASQPHSNTVRSTPRLPTSPIRVYRPSVSTNDPSPAPRIPLHRAISGPSTLSWPKTLEWKATQPPPVFKARTPERRTISSPPDTLSSSSIGKKRRAPDDFENCESLPPQGFTVECLPSHEGNDNANTPLVRRMLGGFQSGFTPVRNQARPTIPIPSPKRLMMAMGTTARSSPVIADVTNSPRGHSAKAKRSWLGKIRGASSHVTSSRAVDSGQG